VGTRLAVEVGSVAHGGHCVARHEGQVIFVRHALPGEQVEVVVTEVGPKNRYLRADAVRVISPSPNRVQPRCPASGPGGCGGCDWQHVSLPAQRQLKTEVVREQMRRLGGVATDVEVEPVPGERDGLGWRTRVRYSVTPDGGPGFRRHRSHEVQAVTTCLLAHPRVAAIDVADYVRPGVAEVSVRTGTGSGSAAVAVLVDGRPANASVGRIEEVAAGRTWQVSEDGFWQVHPGAADLLVDVVASVLEPAPGEHAVDLYSGVGLFAAAMADRLGPGGRVDAVESSASAMADAQVNLSDLATVHLHHARVERFLATTRLRRCDLVVLDPPRAGAGRTVVSRLAALTPRAIGYVACDPAGLARDVAILAEQGYRLEGLRAFDLFPMTQHVECVAWFGRDREDRLIS
jgi:tRNA/tmRNA/rRNA uracil-C5-methylase (TrmA/RlmC/RlmD family)